MECTDKQLQRVQTSNYNVQQEDGRHNCIDYKIRVGNSINVQASILVIVLKDDRTSDAARPAVPSRHLVPARAHSRWYICIHMQERTYTNSCALRPFL